MEWNDVYPSFRYNGVDNLVNKAGHPVSAGWLAPTFVSAINAMRVNRAAAPEPFSIVELNMRLLPVPHVVSIAPTGVLTISGLGNFAPPSGYSFVAMPSTSQITTTGQAKWFAPGSIVVTTTALYGIYMKPGIVYTEMVPQSQRFMGTWLVALVRTAWIS